MGESVRTLAVVACGPTSLLELICMLPCRLAAVDNVAFGMLIAVFVVHTGGSQKLDANSRSAINRLSQVTAASDFYANPVT